jgi:hypothetical protein
MFRKVSKANRAPNTKIIAFFSFHWHLLFPGTSRQVETATSIAVLKIKA